MSNPRVSIILSIYRAERFLQRYLECVASQSILGDIELSIVHNDPSDKERDIINGFESLIRMVRFEIPREKLYASWNRAIAQSSGEYLVCWNVDDLRTSDSIERMMYSLDVNPQSGWTYGDFLISNSYGQTNGRLVNTPEWTQELATRGAIGGPFFMWRRTLLKSIGWFDEQFSSGGDFDYTIRLSLGACAVKTQGILGIFLNENSGLSTMGKQQPIERTVIQLRYGIYETLDWYYVHSALNYRVRCLQQPDEQWIAIEELIPSYQLLIAERHSAAWKIPFHSIKAAVHRFIANYLAIQ